MVIKFWGVRGSLPTPASSAQIQSKIAAAVQRITAEDIKNQDSRERFIASLPKSLCGTVGGNTACVELTGEDGTKAVLDAGSGMRSLGKEGDAPADGHYNLFFSHFHWDHIQGFPFFPPVFDKKSTFDCYSARSDALDVLSKQMSSPYFPVDFDVVRERMTSHTVEAGKEYQVGGLKMVSCPMKHPGGSTSYAFIEDGKKVVYATDVELSDGDAVLSSPERAAVFGNADCVVLDSQYTVAEAYEKDGWGHSAFCYAVDFAAKWDIKHLYLFHHEPSYDDRKLYNILETARWYAQYIERSDVKVHLAREGRRIQI